jgi:2-dehydropantoate 2-reductase
MKILVYGAGGVGGFFGGLLTRAGADVHFVARGAHLDALRSDGLTIRSHVLGDIHLPRLSAVPSAADVGRVDLALICVKTHQMPDILDDLATAIGPDTLIVPLQNGVEADEQLAARFGAARVVPAVVYVGATVEEPGVISHVAAGKIGIGATRDVGAATVATVRDVLAQSGQPVYISNDIQRERWHKLMWNAAFNPVSAITERGPAELLAMPDARALLLAIMREVLDVGRACGVDLRDEDIAEQIAWTEKAAGLRTSTMVDRERGRTMETDALIGVVVRKGKAAGVPTPRCEAVYALLKAVDAGGQ